MPESLTVSTPPQGGAVKRQRSADGRDPQPRPAAAGQNGPTLERRKSSRPQLRSDIRMPAYLEKTRSEVASTFQEIEWKQRFRLFHAMEHPDTSPYRVDRSEVVINRNRYGNVQPWDGSRIKLKTPMGGSDYVNASPIVLKSRVPPPDTATDPQPLVLKYIATQGPKAGQKSHFWHMVHQETPGDTGVVIMLTQLVEESKEKCAQYFPLELDNPTMTLPYDETLNDGTENEEPVSSGDGIGSDPFVDKFHSSGTDESEDQSSEDNTSSTNTPPGPKLETCDTITLISKEYDESVRCEVRKFRLTIDDTSKTIIHYLFGRWPDFGKPETGDRRALIELARRSYREAQGSPRVVHCSAGVGRTGTWIALDFLTREVEDGRLINASKASKNSKDLISPPQSASGETWGRSEQTKVLTPTTEDGGFDKDDHDLIFDTVNALREQRMMMVIREVQFSFLYDAVKEAVLQKYRARPEGAVVKEGSNVDTPRPSKTLRTSEEFQEGSASEAETEIMDVDTNVNKKANNDDEDPYSAVSPDVLRQGMKENM